MVCEPIFHSLSQAKALEEARLSEATIRKFMDAVPFPTLSWLSTARQ
jgi:hypothetical protein